VGRKRLAENLLEKWKGRVFGRILTGDKDTAKPGIPREVTVGKRSTARTRGFAQG